MNKVQQDFEKWALSNWRPISFELRRGEDYSNGELQEQWEAYQAAHNAQQAEIDRLMLEFCPGEMTKTYAIKQPCNCGCNDPFATEPIEMLKFLAQRMEWAPVAEGVAKSYARDIRKVLGEMGITWKEWEK